VRPLGYRSRQSNDAVIRRFDFDFITIQIGLEYIGFSRGRFDAIAHLRRQQSPASAKNNHSTQNHHSWIELDHNATSFLMRNWFNSGEIQELLFIKPFP
jgi:hypothetical protein